MSFRSTVLAAAVAFAMIAAAPAQARPQPLGLGGRIDVWKQVEPLVRAKAGGHGRGPELEPSFELKRGDGYRVRVIGAGSVVAVLVGKAKAVTAYLARGTATSRRLKASFGPFGEVDMRFHPSRRPAPRSRSCRHNPGPRQELGLWSGGFRFVGEGGYISIDSHRAAGEVRPPHLGCTTFHVRRRPQAATSSDPFSSFSFLQTLSAGWHEGLESAQVAGLQIRDRTLFLAFTQEALGRVGILRFAGAAGKADAFTVDDALTHAEASPPQPFHGTGTFTATPDGTKSWLGDLSVNFPGLPRFPLTGAQFEVEVKRPL